MAIPVYLQSFKAAGIYRVVFDKSTINNVDTEILRLVVGYSEQGPFNTPVYVKNPSEFKLLFGNISKKLEKRGIYFHRLALQMLTAGPILCLNLKKFDGETVDGATISTEFNKKLDIISTVKLNVEDIYDTTRFWELNANKLNGLRSVEGKVLDRYINIAATNTDKKSITYFIRKASGQKVAGYNITVNDWYSDNNEEIPEFLEEHKSNLISDYFAEVYVFRGKFDKNQILSSESLKNYFVVTTDEKKNTKIQLRDKVFNAWGEPVDTLDALFADETSGALGHYVGALIPYFKNKQGSYAALDIIFNNEQEVHNAMMSFNTDLLDEQNINLDLSGRYLIKHDISQSELGKIFDGTAKTKLLGNENAPIVADKITFKPNVVDANGKGVIPFMRNEKEPNKLRGTLYISDIKEGDTEQNTPANIVLSQIGVDDPTIDNTIIECDQQHLDTILNNIFGIQKTEAGYEGDVLFKVLSPEDKPFAEANSFIGPKKVITFIDHMDVNPETNNFVINVDTATVLETEESNDENPEAVKAENTFDNEPVVFLHEQEVQKLNDKDVVINFMNVEVESVQEYVGVKDPVYGSSISFIPKTYELNPAFESEGVTGPALVGDDKTLISVFQKGDMLLGESDTDNDDYYDIVFVEKTGMTEDGKYFVMFTNSPAVYDGQFLVKVDGSLNQEIGEMKPCFLGGYVYKNANPEGTNMMAKVNWQDFILSALTDYRGLRTALLNKSEIDFRYVIDTFESFPVSNLKNVLSFLCKEKQSAFCIANFPAVKTFVKCPYTSFTDEKGIFNVEYVVKGYNKKKSAGMRFSIPSDADGASFIAFYTPLKFSDGYIDTIVPSAGLVSNLFIQKYMSRQPYYIVAGPNYGNIATAGLVGPDYKYSMDELQIIEPFGVNCMVYRPNFGTFINANQTAKQIPLSALSKVNVRELVIYLQDEVEKVLQAYQWEFNNPVTRNAILDKVNYICELVKANGGLQAYKNVMDESNNTPEVIDNEFAILSTHIEPGMGCGKMVHELTLYRTGQMKSNIID